MANAAVSISLKSTLAAVPVAGEMEALQNGDFYVLYITNKDGKRKAPAVLAHNHDDLYYRKAEADGRYVRLSGASQTIDAPHRFSSPSLSFGTQFFQTPYSNGNALHYFGPDGGNGAQATNALLRVWDGSSAWRTLELLGASGVMNWNGHTVWNSSHFTQANINAWNAMSTGDYLKKSGDVATGAIRMRTNNVLDNNSYSRSFIAAVTLSDWNDNGARPGYGFHREGSLGTFLYMETATELRLRGTAGQTAIIATTDWVSSNTRSSAWVPSWTQVTGKPTTLAGYGLQTEADGRYIFRTGTQSVSAALTFTSNQLTFGAAVWMTPFSNGNAQFNFGPETGFGSQRTAAYLRVWDGNAAWKALMFDGSGVITWDGNAVYHAGNLAFGGGANNMARGNHTHPALSPANGLSGDPYTGASPVTWGITYGTGPGTVAQGNDARITQGATAYSWGDWRQRSVTGLSSVAGGGSLGSGNLNFYLVGDDAAPGPNKIYSTNNAGAKGWWSISAVGGSGDSGYITKWNTNNSINNSGIYQNGANIGIGTTGPADKLTINGTFGVTDIAAFRGSDVNIHHRLAVGYKSTSNPGHGSILIHNGIDTGNINEALAFQIRSTTRASVPFPRMNTWDFAAIPKVTDGMFAWDTIQKGFLWYDGNGLRGMRYNNDTGKFQGYNGSTWFDFH